MICRNCGVENPNEAKYCTYCGAELTPPQPVNVQADIPNPNIPDPNVAPNQNFGQGYQQPPYGYQAPIQPPKPQHSGMAIASLILGIVSLLCCAVITGPLGVIFGIIDKSKGNKSGCATAGIICGAIGFVLWLILIIFNIILIATGEYTPYY